MDKVCLSVPGIANSQMKTSLKNALTKLEGVQAVDIDKTLGRVEVGFNAPASETQIKSCVEDAGFSLS